jgi:hypothetical protein
VICDKVICRLSVYLLICDRSTNYFRRKNGK